MRWDPFIAKMIATKGPARNYLMEYSFQAAGMFDFGYFAQWRRRVQHGPEKLFRCLPAELRFSVSAMRFMASAT